MTARRRLLAALPAAAAVVALSACEAPAPIVTVVSGTSSEWKEADVYCFDEQSPEQDECAQRSSTVPTLTVTAGDRVGIDVSKDLVERGWFVELGPAGQVQSSQVQEDEHYFAFNAPEVGPDGYLLTVKALGPQGPQGPPSGEWNFRLVSE
jgi:hypothetical protein